VKALHVFLGVDMRKSHDGLILLAKNKKIDLTKLPDETAAVFISANKLRIKTYSYNHIVGYLRANSYRPFDLSAIDEFPRAFDKSGMMNYNKALKAALEKKLHTKGKLKEELL
jgi:hypothetical protein